MTFENPTLFTLMKEIFIYISVNKMLIKEPAGSFERNKISFDFQQDVGSKII